MKKFKAIIAMALCLIFATALVACDGGTQNGGSGNNSSGNQSDSVVFGSTLGLESLDPHTVQQAGTRAILFNVFEGLLKQSSDGGVVEAVAKSYEISEDGTTYTFVLRDGVKFSDGSEVTAEDVKYSIERYAANHSGEGDAFSIFKEAKITGDNTVEIVFNASDNELLSAISLASIIPQSVGDSISTNPVGTGPYKYVSYAEGESLKLEVNENYWGDAPKIANVEFKFLDDPATAYQMLQAGTINVLPYLSADQVATLSDAAYAETGYMTYSFQMFLDSNYAPLSNAKVRQAICYAIDKDSINQITSNGKAGNIGANIPVTMEEYFSADAANTYTYDVEKAKALMAEAGYADGFSLKIAVPNVNTLYTNSAEIIVEELKAIGIDVSMELMETEKWYALYCDGLNDEYQAIILAWDNANLAPNAWTSIFTSTAANNFMHYSNAQYDETFAKAKAASGEEKVKLYNELQKIVAEDAGSAFLFTPADYVGLSTGLKGYTYYPATIWDMSTLYYE